MKLDVDQNAVIINPTGARAVISGPGAGKTTTMVELIRALLDAGVLPSEIRGVTFSTEMAQTLAKRTGLTGVISTFHSLGYAICSETTRKPVEPELRFRLMYKLCKRWSLEYNELNQFIARMRRESIPPASATHPDHELPYSLSHAYEEYEREREAGGWIDFDAMLADSVKLLEDPQVRARWQFKHLVVDEAQDTDNLQWRMIQLMSERYGNVTVVGDSNQCIYSFRGAQPENLTNFEKWFPNGKTLYLGLNYRSSEIITNFVRENAPKGTPKELLDKMRAVRQDKGDPIDVKMYWSEDEEAESAIALAQKDPLNSIILARTNHLVGLLERICGHHSVRYHLLGHTGFWKQNEIRKAVEALKKYPTSTTEAALGIVLPEMERKYAVDDRTERDNDALENLRALREYSKEFRMAKDFSVYANKMVHRRNDPKGVSISTVHQAKGGEWKNVYLIGANVKGFPHPKGDPQEEARIYFVAISRPIDYLRISFTGTPSPYLRRYLTDEILDTLRKHAEEVDRLQEQVKLFA